MTGAQAIIYIINFIFTDTLSAIWSLISNSWILTAFLLMALISSLLIVVIPSSGSKDDE